jgi:hypothetical protein
MRWLYEYSLENFRRQRHVNQVLFACVEELAIENAKLRQQIGIPREEQRDPQGGQTGGGAPEPEQRHAGITRA